MRRVQDTTCSERIHECTESMPARDDKSPGGDGAGPHTTASWGARPTVGKLRQTDAITCQDLMLLLQAMGLEL